MTTSEYQKLYGLRNKQTGKLIFYYWAASQKHKALFATKGKAIDAANWIDGDVDIIKFE